MLLATERRSININSIFFIHSVDGYMGPKLGSDYMLSAILKYYQKFVNCSENWFYAK
jgi:hypothetical protein